MITEAESIRDQAIERVAAAIHGAVADSFTSPDDWHPEAEAAIQEFLAFLQEVKLPREACDAGINAHPENWRDEYDMVRAQFRAIVSELAKSFKDRGEA